MNIKVEPFKNNIGALISCDLKSINEQGAEKIKGALNSYGLV